MDFPSHATREVDRIRLAYARRRDQLPPDYYAAWRPENLFLLQERERALLHMLRQHGVLPLTDKRVLEVGCGEGANLRRLVEYGARPENLAGVDLLEDRIQRARGLSPRVDLRCGNAEELPYEDGSFDMVMQLTVFTSILDEGMKANVARQMLRVLKPGGHILWYDFHISNPRNPDLRGIARQEIYRLFLGCRVHLRRVTLFPPLARLIVPHSWLLAHLLGRIPLLRTHYLGIITKPH